MSETSKYSPEEMAGIYKSRTESDAELLANGAQFVVNAEGDARLSPTAKQVDEIERMGEGTAEAKKSVHTEKKEEKDTKKQQKIDSLVAAIEAGNTSAFVFLSMELRNLNIRDSSGETPLIAAIKSEKKSLFMHVLVSPGVDVNFPDKQGRTPLWHALRLNKKSLTTHLLAHGAH